MPAILRSPLQIVSERLEFMSRAVIVVFLAGWILWFAPFDDLLDKQGTPLGADFSMFYAAGRVARDGRFERLYDQSYHQLQLHRLFPQLDNSFCLPFRYPPWVAVAASWLARLPYPAAFAIFFGTSLALWLWTIRLLLNRFGPPDGFARHSIGWALAGWPVVWETLIGGQASFFAATIAVSASLLLRGERPILAGAVIALASYKPNVLALFAVGLIVRHPRMLLGIAPVAAGLVIAGHWLGTDSAFGEYIVVLGRLTDGPWDVESPYWKIHGLSSWISLAIPRHGRLLTMLLGIAASIAMGVLWRRREREGQSCLAAAISSLLVINSLLNPYTPIYDLVLLGPAAVFAAQAVREAGRRGAWSSHAPSLLDKPAMAPIPMLQLQLILATLFFGPHLSQSLAKGLGFQFFPLALVVIAVATWRWVDVRRECERVRPLGQNLARGL